MLRNHVIVMQSSCREVCYVAVYSWSIVILVISCCSPMFIGNFFFIISFLSLSCSVKRIWWPCPTPTYLSSARLKCSFEPQWPENLCKPSSCSNFSWRLHSVTPFMTLCIWYWDHCFVTWLCEKQVSLSQRWLQLHPLFNHGWVFILWTSVSFVLLRTRHL